MHYKKNRCILTAVQPPSFSSYPSSLTSSTRNTLDEECMLCVLSVQPFQLQQSNNPPFIPFPCLPCVTENNIGQRRSLPVCTLYIHDRPRGAITLPCAVLIYQGLARFLFTRARRSSYLAGPGAPARPVVANSSPLVSLVGCSDSALSFLTEYALRRT